MAISPEDFMNETEFENDPFASVNEDFVVPHSPDFYNILTYYLIICVILKFILLLVVLAGNIFLTVVMFRFKRLRAVRTNVYILHLTILNIVYYLSSPLFYVIGTYSGSYEVSTLVLQTQITFLLLYLTFAVGLALDWFLTAKQPNLMAKIEGYYKYIYAGIYLVFLIEWLISFVYSEIHHLARAGIFLIFYLVYIVILIVLNVLKMKLNFRSQSKKTEYALSVSNIILFSFLPIFLFHFIYQALILSTRVEDIFIFFEIFPALIEIGHPILVIYILGKKNKYFKMAYYKSFRRSVRNYEEEDLDVVSEDDDVRNALSGTSNGQVSLSNVLDKV